eukprot:scpid23009/ scgid11620/ 
MCASLVYVIVTIVVQERNGVRVIARVDIEVSGGGGGGGGGGSSHDINLGAKTSRRALTACIWNRGIQELVSRITDMPLHLNTLCAMMRPCTGCFAVGMHRRAFLKSGSSRTAAAADAAHSGR